MPIMLSFWQNWLKFAGMVAPSCGDEFCQSSSFPPVLRWVEKEPYKLF